MAESVPAPSGSGSVVLDLGPDIGALVLHAPRNRTHSRVRQRHTPGGIQYAAVYPGLAAGEYLVWRDTTTSAMIVTIAGGQVTTAYWPGHQPVHGPGHEGSPGPG